MSELSLDFLSDLFAEGKAEIKKAKAQKEQSKKEIAAKKQKAKLEAFYLPTKSMIDEAGWTAISQVAQIIIQSCECCGSTTKYIAGNTLRQKHKSNLAFREIHAPVDATLPLEVRYHSNTTAYCAECIDIQKRVEDLFPSAEHNPQLSLFG